jgi:hypothetical protein
VAFGRGGLKVTGELTRCRPGHGFRQHPLHALALAVGLEEGGLSERGESERIYRRHAR